MADYSSPEWVKEYITLLKEASTSVNKLADAEKARITALSNGKKVTEETTKATNAEKKAVDELTKIKEKNKKLVDQLIAAGTNENKINIQLKQSLTAKNKALRDEAKASAEAATSRRKAEEALKINIKTTKDAENVNKALRLAVKYLDDTTEKGVATIKKYNDIINKNDERINKNSDKRKQATQNVGNYTESIMKAITELEKEGQALARTAAFQSSMIKSGKLSAAQQDKLQSEFAQTTAKLNQINDKLKAYGNNTISSAAKSATFKKDLLSVGKQMAGFTTIAAAATMALRKIGQEFKDAQQDVILFEKSFTNVLTLLDEFQKAEFADSLREGAIDVISEFGLGIEDVNQSLFDAVSAGVPAGEAIQFLNQSAKVAVAGNAELSSVIDGATTIINAYGSKAGSTTEILNAFFAAQVKGKTTVGLLASNIGKVASSAASADIPINELLSTTAQLTTFLGGTEESTTALTNVINAIIKPSDEAAKAFADMGIDTGITAVKQEGLITKLLQVANAYEEDNDVLTELIPNIRAFRGLAGLTSDAVAELEGNIADLNDTEASSRLVQNAYNEQMSTRQKEIDKLNQSWKALILSTQEGDSGLRRFGRTWRTAITKNFTKTREDLKVINDSSESFFKKIGSGMKIAFLSTSLFGRALGKAKDDMLELSGFKPDFSMDDDMGEAPEPFEIDFESLEKQQEEQQKVLDGYLEIEKAKRGITGYTQSDADKDYQRDIQAQIDAADELSDTLLQISKDEYAEELAEEEAYLEEINNMRDDAAKKEKRRNDDEAKAAEELRDLKVAIANELFNFTGALGDAKIARLQLEVDSEGEITATAAAEIAKIQKRQAVLDKAQSLFNIGINTAQAITKAGAQLGVFAVPVQVALGVLGAVQAATVLATPIPQFKDGVKNFSGGMAIVGDGGESELIRNPDGSMFMTPDVPTATYLQKGADVLNQNQIKNEYGADYNKLLSEQKKTNDLLSAQLNKKQPSPMTARQYEKVNRKQAFRDKVAIKSQGKQ